MRGVDCLVAEGRYGWLPVTPGGLGKSESNGIALGAASATRRNGGEWAFSVRTSDRLICFTWDGRGVGSSCGHGLDQRCSSESEARRERLGDVQELLADTILKSFRWRACVASTV